MVDWPFGHKGRDIERREHNEDQRLEREEIKELKNLEQLEREEIAILKDIRSEGQRMSSIKIAFDTTGGNMAPVLGALIFNVGDTAVASVQGFDQTGALMPADFVMPPVTYVLNIPSDGNPPNASLGPNPNGNTSTPVLTALAGGASSLTATVTSAEGATLSDTESVTVPPPVVKPPVLTSIKVAFDVTPVTPPAAAAAKKA